jgi:DNA polymerase-3 subunit epsilon
MATAQLLKHLLKADSGNKIEAALKQLNKESVLPPMLDKNVFRNLPNKTGIYRFHNREGKVVYVGKAIDIKKRIQGHFLEHSVIKGVLKEHIADISYELSGTELLAFLIEACEIKMHFPVFNRAAKYATNSYGIVIYTSREGRKMLGISKKTRYLELRGSFSSLMQTREFLRNMVVEFELCPALSGLQKEHSCINCYSDELCFGSETVEVYNQKVEAALRQSWRLSQRHAYLLNGRTEEEMAFVLIENGAFKGFGFMNEEEFDGGYKSLEKALIARHNFSEIDRILSSPSLMSDIRDVWVLPTENDFFESPKSEINMPKLGLFSTL